LKVNSEYQPTGDQPQAIDRLASGLDAGMRAQTLLGVTGSGKTHTMARVIEKAGRPALVIAHNKTLAAQLASEFSDFFPNNAVEYFVSYYDYYQPEAYVPRTDTFIEKDAQINEDIDRLRHSATSSLFTRRDVIVVASVSAIYGLGSPDEYRSKMVLLEKGGFYDLDDVLRDLVRIQYTRNDFQLARGTFRVRGDVLEVHPAYQDTIYRISFFGDEVESIAEVDPLSGEILREMDTLTVYPATHFVTDEDRLTVAVRNIEAELEERSTELDEDGKVGPAAPAHSLRPRDAAGGRLHLGHRELLAPPRWATGWLDAVHASRLLPRRLPNLRGRVAYHVAPGAGDVQRRPLAQDHPRRVRLPATFSAGQPAAQVGGVPAQD
jgi:excinuclease ABC subunit B